MDGPNFARVAALLADNARAEVLSVLMADRALTATELADVAGVTRQTISFHLAKLVEAGLVTAEKQGRHRYFRLAGAEVAELLESLVGVAFRADQGRLRAGPRDVALRKARVCYDHLAGELGVVALDGLLHRNVLRPEHGGLALTPHGGEWFRDIGIDPAAVAARKRSFCRPCLDWSERRHHLAGALGAALLTRIQELGWATLAAKSRVVTFSAKGEQAFLALFAAPPVVSAYRRG